MEKLDNSENKLPTTISNLMSESHRPGVEMKSTFSSSSFTVKFYKWQNKYVLTLEVRALVSLEGEGFVMERNRMVPL